MAVKTILICDVSDCNAELELDGPYHIAKEEMKAEGWRNEKIDGEWKIKCNNHPKGK
jgi:hypothetical protein